MSPSFDASRTEEFLVDIVEEGECRERIFVGDDPEIVIYATEEGAPVLPIWFLAIGVAAVPAAGVTTAAAGGGAAGGLGAGTLAGIAAGGALGAVAVADAIDESPPPPPPEEPPASPVN